MAIEMSDLRTLLACPACHGTLAWTTEQAACGGCGRLYRVEDGIPVLLLDAAAAEHDELEHLHGHEHKAHKQKQAAFFDREDAADFEVNRPHGTPALYSWMLGEKFRRGTAGVRDALGNATALTVCAGSGMDAEFLSSLGARVISSDISLGAARRARERARRYGFAMLPIVADVEHLPFRDQAVDVVFVHDGLHHLERPLTGLTEMARVAGRAVSVTEPARAGLTWVAIKLGMALDREEAGNRVARLTLDEIGDVLRAQGFRVVRAERYAMYYKHEPGNIFRQLSRPAFFPAVKGAYRVTNAALGRVGNKLTVQAVRG